MDGAAQCWGADTSGQVGDGLLARRFPLPWRVRGLPAPVTAVAAGGSHSCAVAAGSVSCWGDNTRAQVGSEGPHLAVEPLRVAGLPEPATAVAAGAQHTCAIAAGEVFCWGRDRDGSLGRRVETLCRGGGSAVPCSATPVRVPRPAGLAGEVRALAVGRAHACAVAGGAVFCWGRGDRGRLGDGAAAAAGPVRVRGLPPGATAVAAGAVHACALASGSVWCWGANDRGQLGDGSRDDRREPVRALAKGATALAAGARHTCAVAEGRVLCWGDDAEGQARGGAGGPPVLTPAPVAGLPPGATALAAGADLACAAFGAEVRCWGDNDFGQLGSGDAPRDHAAPARVAAWDDGSLRDRDGDGRRVVACLGDSNTNPRSRRSASWCDLLSRHFPDPTWRAVNRSAGGATALSRASLFRAEDHLHYALENDAPDAVILAYGTNDVLQGVSPEDVVLAYAEHRRRAREAGVAAFVALTPPIHPSSDPRNARVRELNDWLRRSFPAERLVDFWSGFGAGDYEDALHLNGGAQARRARAAWAALSGGEPPAGASP